PPNRFSRNIRSRRGVKWAKDANGWRMVHTGSTSMQHRLLAAAPLFFLVLLATPSRACAESAPQNPLRLMPAETDFIVEVRNPRHLIDALKTLDAVEGFLKLEAVQEFYDSTTAHRLYQLLAYLEKELGAKWPDLLNQISGGGAVLGVKIGPQPAPALLV